MAAGPFFSQSLAFALQSASGMSAFGTLIGGFVARFDSIGPKSPVEVGASGFISRSA